MFVNRHRDRRTTAKFWRIQISYFGGHCICNVIYFILHTLNCLRRRIHLKWISNSDFPPWRFLLPEKQQLRGTDLERSLAVYQWLVEVLVSPGPPVTPMLDPGRLLVAPRGSCDWKAVDPQQVWDSWWYQFPSRTVTSSTALIISWYFVCFCLFCLLSSHKI